MRFIFAALAVLAVLIATALGILGYTKLMARVAPGTPPAMATPQERADEIIVSKADKMLYLMREGAILKTYPIVMGANWRDGHKTTEGDERTPEGRYLIDWRNPKSVAHLSLHISYPNPQDQAQADAAGVAPGGNIMIHGLPNGWGALGALHLLWDWTNGCIAVTNDQIREIWSLVANDTPITIHAQWSPNQS